MKGNCQKPGKTTATQRIDGSKYFHVLGCKIKKNISKITSSQNKVLLIDQQMKQMQNMLPTTENMAANKRSSGRSQ
jgi:hypothetical protein